MIPFTGYPLDRADLVRADDAALERYRRAETARALVLWRGKPLLLENGGALLPAWIRPAQAPPGAWVELWLGRTADDEGRFAVCLDPTRPADPTALAPPEGARFEDLRPAAGRLSLDDTALVGTARSVFAWHRSHRFCANCGAATLPIHAGWKRRCEACDRQHFPRVDPVVIALITHGDRVLLGRGPHWPAGFFSCLAGFVEPGETLGEATRREAREEADVTIGDVTYLFSQPWPFPSSLMLGVRAEAQSEHVRADGVELAEARWFTREEVAQMFAGTHPSAHPPFPIAVAHHLLKHWLAA